MLVRTSVCTLLVAGLVAGAGCEGVVDVELEDAVGTFVLKRVAGKKLPDAKDRDDRDGLDGRDGRRDRDDRRSRPRLIAETAEFEVLIEHETIRLRPDGTGTITSVVDLFRIEDGMFEERRTITRDVRFVLDDGRIEIVDLCRTEADCVLPRDLIMRPEPSWFQDVLYQAFSPFDGPALLYERVSVSSGL